MAQIAPEVSGVLEKALALSTRDRGLLIDRLIAPDKQRVPHTFAYFANVWALRAAVHSWSENNFLEKSPEYRLAELVCDLDALRPRQKPTHRKVRDVWGRRLDGSDIVRDAMLRQSSWQGRSLSG